MRVTVNIPDPVGREAERAARAMGVSVSSLYAEAVEAHLRERRRKLAVARVGALIGSVRVAPEALDEIRRDRENSERSPA